MLSLVVEPFVGEVITGGIGGVVSIIIFTVLENGLVLFAMSTEFAEIGCPPSPSEIPLVNDQFPELSAVVIPSNVIPSYMLTVELASAIPETVGVLSFVVELFEGEVIVGA